MTEPENAAKNAAGEVHTSQRVNDEQPSREGTPPPLPPRPKPLQLLGDDDLSGTSPGALKTPKQIRPPLQSKATTALSLADIHTFQEGSNSSHSRPSSRSHYTGHGIRSRSESSGRGGDDAISVRSIAPTLAGPGIDAESMMGEVIPGQEDVSWKAMLSGRAMTQASLFPDDPAFDESFAKEFDEVDEIKRDASNEDIALAQWKSKLKHFLVLTSAGKPVWSRHGDDQLITNYIGIVQTIISFYQGAKDELRGFTAGDVRFVVLTKGNINLVAISRLGESDSQLKTQLESLYMQILSTLTLPTMNRMFTNRPSTDLRRPLQGTETLLSALADGFTRGSPSTLLSALECLKLRKSHRHVINNTLLKTRCQDVLYGLIVAGGRLVSVVRPKKHSLHPGDLHLIFNMLFEAGSVQAGGGENWIPLCLPGFNNTGYLYMYVSFLDVDKEREVSAERPGSSNDRRDGGESEVAIILISANKEAFFELRGMRDDVVEQLRKNGGLNNIRTAIKRGRPACTDIIPGAPLRHFLYKSRGNVQFVMPKFDPHFTTPLARRRLLNLYMTLHQTLHQKPSSSKIHHSTQATCITLAWMTPLFELYAIAPATTSRAALALAANKLVQWVRREEERVFIIGGAVF